MTGTGLSAFYQPSNHMAPYAFNGFNIFMDMVYASRDVLYKRIEKLSHQMHCMMVYSFD